MSRTSLSYFWYSFSFCFLYSSISLCASLFASFTLFERSASVALDIQISHVAFVGAHTLSGFEYVSTPSHVLGRGAGYLSVQFSGPLSLTTTRLELCLKMDQHLTYIE